MGVTDDEEDAQRSLEQFLEGGSVRPPEFADKTLISARISKVAHAGLKQLAQELGYTRSGVGNVSMLLEAIGTNTVTVQQRSIADLLRSGLH